LAIRHYQHYYSGAYYLGGEMKLKLIIAKFLRRELRIKIIDCFKDVKWVKQSFVINGVRLDVDGETNFYKASDVDSAIDKVNKILKMIATG
jgi:hypothetical protein